VPRRTALRLHLSRLLLVVGLLMLAEVAATLLWQEPVSAVLHARAQGGLERELEAIERDTARRMRRADPVVPELARALARESRAGGPIGRIAIERIGLRAVVVEGTGESSLRSGPGHYSATPLPGQGGTVGVAGHRSSYGAPFRRLDDVRRGDRVAVTMPYGRFAYEVESVRVVDPGFGGALRRGAGERLVLTACHPVYSAERRIVVTARLTGRPRPRMAPR
jgi:sortase A